MVRLFRILIPIPVLMLCIAEAGIVFGCLTASSYIHASSAGPGFLYNDLGVQRIGLMVVLVIGGFYFSNLYSDVRVRSRIHLAQRLCWVMGMAFISQAFISYVAPEWGLPSAMMISGSVLSMLLLFAVRVVFSFAVGNKAVASQKVLFLGSSPVVEHMKEHLRSHVEFGMEPIGTVSFGGEQEPADVVARPQSLAELLDAIDACHPDIVVIDHQEEVGPDWIDDFVELRFGGVQSLSSAAFYELTFSRVCGSRVSRSDLLFNAAWQPAASTLEVQSIYSLLLAVLALIVLSPLMLIAALAILLTSPGPLLQRSLRVGQYGEPFTLYRFRVPDSATGRLIRKLRLDLLPGFYNVLRGDMAMVGPRPVRPEFSERLGALIPFYAERYRVPPGFFGSGGPEYLSRDAMIELEYDLYYIKYLAPSLDVMILMRAIKNLVA